MSGKTGNKERVYVIGERGVGVYLIKINPLRVAQISDAEVQRYGEATNGDGYAKVAGHFWKMIAEHKAAEGHGQAVDDAQVAKVESQVGSGAALTDVDFAFSTNITPVSVLSTKARNIPIKAALCHLTHNEGDALVDAVLKDDDSDSTKC